MKKRYMDWKLFSASIKDHLKYGDSMRKISTDIGVSASTFSRAYNGKTVDLDTAIQICCWMNESIINFIKTTECRN